MLSSSVHCNPLATHCASQERDRFGHGYGRDWQDGLLVVAVQYPSAIRVADRGIAIIFVAIVIVIVFVAIVIVIVVVVDHVVVW